MSKYYRVWNSKTKNSWMINPGEIKNLAGRESQFVSVCYYNEDQYKEFQKTRSVAGVTNTKTNQIWFDFDSHFDLNQPKNDTVTLINRLLKRGLPEESIEIYFSGHKGFHVIVKVQDELTPYQVKKIVNDVGNGLETLDKQVYDFNRILRAPGTKHEKTGLYKIQIPINLIHEMTIDSIREYAKHPGQPLVEAKPVKIPSTIITNTELLIGEVSAKKAVKIDANDPLRIKEIDFKNKPAGWRDYKWSISQGRFEIGNRNHAMMVTASTCRALKYGRDHTAAICYASDKLHCEITGDDPITDTALEREVLDVVFGDHWNGGQYSIENDLKLREYCEKHGFKTEKDSNNEVIELNQVSVTFKDFVKNIDKNTILTGIKKIDEAVPITIGMNLGLIGAASAGKTAVALEVLKHTSMNGVISVMASLDMHRNRLYEKVLNKVSHEVYGRDISRKELYEIFQNDKESKLVEEVHKQYGNVYFYDRSSPSIDDLRKFVLTVEEQTGKKVKLLMIDYFERIGSEISDATQSSLKVANQLQDLLNDLNLAIITLVQPNKFSLAGGPDSPILNYTAIKGSSFLYQSFRAIISIWRPFFTPRTKHLDKFLEMAILKNDLGELDHFKFNWEGKTGTITEATEEQERIYNEYLEEKKTLLNPSDGKDEQGSYGNFRRN